MPITAPYNFVPLNKEVFYPEWSEQVSHDVPFEDGESGEIEITITAKSPIFIRDHANPEQFCQHNGQYYIPSTSVKGMVRNVLEIMSFGEMPFDEQKLSKSTGVRDMSNSKELVGVATGCGFLKQDSQGKWFIEDYGIPRTIEYTNKKDKTFTIDDKPYTFTLNKNDKNMSAREKYSLLDMNYKAIKIKKDVEDLIDNKGNKIGTKPVAKINNQGEDAYLICTGEITNKEHEFVFASSDRKQTLITNIEDAVARFKTVYFDSDSVDGNYWKNNRDPEIGIPVFYRKKDGKYDIGLTQLFKLLYPHTMQSAIKQTLETIHIKGKNDTKLDLAKTIFGAIRKEADSLKGRVYFSHFKTEAKPQVFIKDLTMTLGGPKPSFYPTYIRQNCQNDGKVQNDKYNTLMQGNSVIAGWKKYPIHHNNPDVKSVQQSDTTVTFNPLGKYKQDGTFEEFSFVGKLRYHNIKPKELGAILSALTFHDNAESFYHNIGLAKAYGFGKIEIKIDTSKHQDSLKAFEAMMTNWSQQKIKKEWVETEQIKELFAMHYKNTDIDRKLKYLILDPEKKINKFSDAKNEKLNKQYKGRECLPKFSVLSSFSNTPKSLLNSNYFEQIKQQSEQAAKAKKESDEISMALASENIDIISNAIKKYPQNESIEQLKTKLHNLEVAQKQNKFDKINNQAQEQLEKTLSQPDKKKKKEYLGKFIDKWSKDKENQGSKYILDLVEQAKQELKK